MKRSTVKSAFDIQLKGVTVELEMLDNSIRAITFIDSDGNDCKVSMTNFSMVIDVKAKPKMIEKHQVSGDMRGIKFSELFDDKYAAERRKIELSDVCEAAIDVVMIEEDDKTLNIEQAIF